MSTHAAADAASSDEEDAQIRYLEEKLAVSKKRIALTRKAMELMTTAVKASVAGNVAAACEADEELWLIGENLYSTIQEQVRFADGSDVGADVIVQGLVHGYRRAADHHSAIGKRSEEVRFRNRAMELAKRHLDQSKWEESAPVTAGDLAASGKYNEALTLLAAAREGARHGGDLPAELSASFERVSLLHWLGDFERARAELLDCESRLDSVKLEFPPIMKGDVYSVFESTFDLVKMVETPGHSAQFSTELKLSGIRCQLDYYWGLIEKACENYEAAEARFRRALPYYRKAGTPEALEFHLASILIRQGRFTEGLAALEAIRPVFTKNSLFRPKYSAFLGKTAEALSGVGRLDEAMKTLRKALKDARQYPNRDADWVLHRNMARLLASRGHRAKALAEFRKALDLIDGLRVASMGYRLDSTHLSDKIEIFGEAIELASSLGRPGDCLEWMEMVKSRSLTFALASPAKEAPEAAPSDNKARFEATTIELRKLEYARMKAGDDPAPQATLQERRDALLRERADLLEELRIADPRFRALTVPRKIDLEAVGQLLRKRGQAALDLFIAKDDIYCVLIDGNGIEVSKTTMAPGTRDAIAAYVRNLALPEATSDPLLHDVSDPVGLGVFARHLVSPAALDRALAAESLVIAPHGDLHLLPWAGLLYKSKRLFEYCPVGIIPSLHCIELLEGTFSRTPAILVFGDPDYSQTRVRPLANARQEINALIAHYGSSSRRVMGVFVRGRASKANLQAFLANEDVRGGILHLCCHGVTEPDEPMNSGLLLSDSRMDAAEISRSSLPVDEVVLSACSTGWRPATVRGVRLAGDDIVGLPGAFIEAGARAVLVSIPPAADGAACTFMDRYHASRANGLTPLRALRATQLSMQADPRFGERAYEWLGFTGYSVQ